MEPQSQFPFSPVDLFRTLTGLITPMGVQGSGGELFKGAIFGRDSLRVALDLLPWFPSLGEMVIFSLAQYQSTQAIPVADAKRAGQIPHEIRSLFVGSRKVGKGPQEILADLSAKWGGSDQLVVQYGSADATPQFVRLVAAYCRRHGREILDEKLRRTDGTVLTLRDVVHAAASWTEKEVQVGERPLLVFQRTNREHGHRWQILQDGATSIIHTDGHLANADARVETIGLQGLAYDCLLDAAELLDDGQGDASRWRELASSLQAATFEAFWMPEERMFGMAIDRDPADGTTPRLIRTLSAIATELLETRIFDSLPEDEQGRYVSGIVGMAHGPEFLTPAGIRSRGLRHLDLLPYPDYHGVLTCWGVTNSVYAAGLARQGLHALRQDITTRHVGMLAAAGALYEFLYVDAHGSVRHPLLERTPSTPEDEVIYGTNRPETDQGWTVSFVLRAALEAGEAALPPPSSAPWQDALTDTIAKTATLRSGFGGGHDAMRPGYLDRETARERETAYIASEI